MTKEEIIEAAEFMVPNAFMAAGNGEADGSANRARAAAEERPGDLRYCAGAPRFFFTWGGHMVVERVNVFVRRKGCENALEEWAARNVQGAVARAVRRREVSGEILRLSHYRGAVAERFLPESDRIGPPGQAFCPDRLLWKIRNYCGGSWTSFLHAGGAGRIGAEVGTSAVDELCPLCLAARGDFRHVAHSCQAEDLPRVRGVLWDKAEAVLLEERTLEEWKDLQHPAGHPKGWCGAVDGEEGEQRWPLLTWLGWLVPTDHEGEIAEGLAARRPVESGYDLGYRGWIGSYLIKFIGA